MIVTKFGGSSLADAKQFEKVRNILNMDSRRIFVIPSAPGKRFDEDEKVTDLFYKCHDLNSKKLPFNKEFARIRQRYLDIASDLELLIDMNFYLNNVEMEMKNGANRDYCASRGEYLNGILLANYLGFTFIDPADTVFFHKDGSFDSETTNTVMRDTLKKMKNAVIPGFYGSLPDGGIKTFSRGGSDITGAIVARAVNAEVYENWTDVSGFLMADPRIVSNPKLIHHITYHEMHELSRAGATVLHEDSVFPVDFAGIPTNIRNTNAPEHKGTMITSSATHRENFAVFAGVAGKKGFSMILAEKEVPDNSPELIKEMFQVIKNCGLHYEHLPSGVNNICFMVPTEDFNLVKKKFFHLTETIETPHKLTISHDMALVVLVGYGVIHNHETIIKICKILKASCIDIYMLNQGSSELSTWIGVRASDLDATIRTIYAEFMY